MSRAAMSRAATGRMKVGAVSAALIAALAACGGDGPGGDGPGGAASGGAASGRGPALASVIPIASQREQELPEGVTPAMIARGADIFTGPGICATCHGADARGIPNLGADLADDEWLRSTGSYEDILQTIREGVPATASTSGVPMPPAGGSTIDDAQIRAVAAYVWSLSAGT